MNAFRRLLEVYWISKEKEPELYNNVKREIDNYRRFLREQLGWQIIKNEKILKIEKIPAHGESFMGITDFKDIKDYCFFAALLIFLEDKEDYEQFLLSEMIAALEVHMREFMEVDFTMFTQRKSLVRVLQFAETMNLLEVYEGSSEQLTGGTEQEVLYENTGLSRYFAINFSFSISDFTSYEDFEKAQIKELEADRGHIRINRVYRQLAVAPAMYWKSMEDQDSLYLKNQRPWVAKYLDENLGGKLHIHKNAAFFVMEEDDCYGEQHPREATVSAVVLNVCNEIRTCVAEGILVREANDCIVMDRESFQRLVVSCKKKNKAAWSKEFREMEEQKLIGIILSYMQSWMIAGWEHETIVIYPAAGKFIGTYPEDFLQKEAEKNG